MRNIKTYSEYIQENFSSPTVVETEYDINNLGDERKEISADFIAKQEFDLPIVRSGSMQKEQAKKDADQKAMEELKTLKDIDKIEANAKEEIDRYKEFSEKQ